MSEEQQQAAAPAANDTKTSWSFGDFAKGLGSPLTKNEDGSYNVAGALMTGAGSGLVTWVLSRMLGVKSGPSLGISILAALAGTHGAFTKQGGLDFFSNPMDYLKAFMDQKRVNNGQSASSKPETPPSVVDKRFMSTPEGQRVAEMTSDEIRSRLDELDRGGVGYSEEARTLMAELQSRNKAINLKYAKPEDESVNETETSALIMALDDLRERESYIRKNYPENTEALKDIADARAEIQEKMRLAIMNDEGLLNWNRNALMESQRNPEADKMGNGTVFYPSIEPGKDLQKAMRRSKYLMMDSIPWRQSGRIAPVFPSVIDGSSPIEYEAQEQIKPPVTTPIPTVPSPYQTVLPPPVLPDVQPKYHPSFTNPFTTYFGTSPHGSTKQQPISKELTPPLPRIPLNRFPPGMSPSDAIQMAIDPNNEIINAVRNQ